MVSKLVAVVSIIAMGLALQILILTLGWGLELKSWGWVIGIGLFGQTWHAILARKVMEDFVSGK